MHGAGRGAELAAALGAEVGQHGEDATGAGDGGFVVLVVGQLDDAVCVRRRLAGADELLGGLAAGVLPGGQGTGVAVGPVGHGVVRRSLGRRSPGGGERAPAHHDARSDGDDEHDTGDSVHLPPPEE